MLNLTDIISSLDTLRNGWNWWLGDTLGVLWLMGGALVLLLVVPIGLMQYFGVATVYTMWIAFTVYVILLAVGAMVRFYRRGWHTIRVVETPPVPE